MALVGCWLTLIVVLLAAGEGSEENLTFASAPLIYVTLYYIWSMLIRDPFAPDAAFCCCEIDSAPRNLRALKYFYFALVVMAATSFVIQEEVFVLGLEPHPFMVFGYNALGFLQVVSRAAAHSPPQSASDTTSFLMLGLLGSKAMARR